jgi:hypothetical protein
MGAGTSAHVDVRVTRLPAATAAARTATLDLLVDAQVASNDHILPSDSSTHVLTWLISLILSLTLTLTLTLTLFS